MTLAGGYEPRRAIGTFWVSLGLPGFKSEPERSVQNWAARVPQTASPLSQCVEEVIGYKRMPNDEVIEMEDPRCRIAAIEMEDLRCRSSLNGVVIEFEDLRCKSLIDRVVLEVEDARCHRMAIKMEDPRCKSLLMTW
jgi:hypothetical protein